MGIKTGWSWQMEVKWWLKPIHDRSPTNAIQLGHGHAMGHGDTIIDCFVCSSLSCFPLTSIALLSCDIRHKRYSGGTILWPSHVCSSHVIEKGMQFTFCDVYRMTSELFVAMPVWFVTFCIDHYSLVTKMRCSSLTRTANCHKWIKVHILISFF